MLGLSVWFLALHAALVGGFWWLLPADTAGLLTGAYGYACRDSAWEIAHALRVIVLAATGRELPQTSTEAVVAALADQL